MATNHSEEPRLLGCTRDADMPAVLVALLASPADPSANAESKEQSLHIQREATARRRVVRANEGAATVAPDRHRAVGGPQVAKEQSHLGVGEAEDRLGDELVP